MKLVPPLSIGVVGGTGKTGGQFAGMLRDHGFRVDVTGEVDRGRNADLLRDCDIIVFAVPLRSSTEVLREELARSTREDQLILDLSSLKQRQVEAMLTAKGEVIGMHPLFGPSTDPRGQIVILCPARASDETRESLQNLLAAMGMRTLLMTPEAHDRLMAVVQVIPHLKSLLIADLLKSLSADMTEISDVCTPAYELELNVVGRFLDDSADLYGPIILDNPRTPEVMAHLRRLADEYATMDLDSFTERYNALHGYFGRFAREGRSHTEACIRTLSSLKGP